jgi:ferritin
MKKLLTEKEIALINGLGKEELTASHVYTHLCNSMKTLGFFGAEKFFLAESLSEREHYNKLEGFMNDMNEQIDVPALDAVDVDISDLMDAFEYAYDMESGLLAKYEDAWEKGTPKMKALINEFIDIQVQAVGEYGDLIARLSRTNEPIFIDQELGK